jgi:oligopeptide/dipeptide ABC transporter ATP-binding protein
VNGVSPLIEVNGLTIKYPATAGLFGGRWFTAVDGVSFSIRAGETLALVGESGCGKTSIARAIVGLQRPASGEILIEGRSAWDLDAAGWRHLRRTVQMVFQNPFESLNPRKTILQTLAQPLLIHHIVPRHEIVPEAERLLDLVGLTQESSVLRRYPHEFSGGQRQRIAIARALAVRPQLLVADEPVSALDISIRAQILTLLRRLQNEFGLSYLFISHDIGVVRQLADGVKVMYLGQVVEEGRAGLVLKSPRHPYTRALLRAIPVPDPRRPIGVILDGELPSPLDPPVGCRFHPRCPIAETQCKQTPPWMSLGDGHFARCLFANDAKRLARDASGVSVKNHPSEVSPPA